MDSLQAAATERPTLTFSVEGLHTREELLFKAVVRLLGHLTYQQWRYQPASAANRVDLLVAADGTQPTYSTGASHPALAKQPVLRIHTGGVSEARGHGYLSWPIKADALEAELNYFGSQAIAQRETQKAVAFLAPEPNPTTASVAQPNHLAGLLRLKQWPPARLLAGPGRMRLATLLTGKAMSLAELAYRSALPLPLCELFAGELDRAGLLLATRRERSAAPLVVALPKMVQVSLLERIRMRLGIQSLIR